MKPRLDLLALRAQLSSLTMSYSELVRSSELMV